MTRWAGAAGSGSGRSYAERFERLAAQGRDMHGEADFVTVLRAAPARVLDAGCGTGRVAVRLAAQGYECVGVDLDTSMLEQARRTAPHLTWVQADLAEQPLALGGFDIVVAAGNVLPLVQPGTEATVVAYLAGALASDGVLVAGFGLDAAHLPLAEAPFALADYDAWCAQAGLVLAERYATWDRAPYRAEGYAVSVHRRAQR